MKLIDRLYQNPFVGITKASEIIGQSFPTAKSLIDNLTEKGILTEITGVSAKESMFYLNIWTSLRNKGIFFAARNVVESVYGNEFIYDSPNFRLWHRLCK
ncbi:MAG: hypothetical protein IJU90_03410 [Bacteroidales bacterium]|nr:hypothetical protein [Bacteroidales bacterium]